MSKRVRGTVSAWTPKLIPILGTILGVFIGMWLDRKLSDPTIAGEKPLFTWEGYSGFFINDLIVTIIGLILLFVGSKIHRIVRYVGLGMIGFELAEELWEITTGEPSI